MKALRGLAVVMALFCAGSFVVAAPAGAAGGSGGSNKTVEARVTGYVTSIDYVSGTITVGASYYGTGVLKCDSNTKVSMDNVSCSFYDINVGDWCEARYDYTSRVATRLACTSIPSP